MTMQTEPRYIAAPWQRAVFWTVINTATNNVIVYVDNEIMANRVAEWLNTIDPPDPDPTVDEPDIDPDSTLVCCPQCGNTNFIEVPRHTTNGLTYFLQCANDDCAVVIIQ